MFPLQAELTDVAAPKRAHRLSPAWAAAGLALPFLGFVQLVHVAKGVPIAYLTQDVTVVGDVAFYAGFLSNAGIVFWCATAALCLFSAFLLADARPREEQRAFLLAAGALTALLALDDLFRLHETVFPSLAGIPEHAVYAVYAGLGLAFVLRFRATVLSRQARILVVSMLCLGTSVALDAFPMPGVDPFVLEDGFKFVGIVSWFVYFVHACALALNEQRLQRDVERYLALGCTIDPQGRVFAPDAVQVDDLNRRLTRAGSGS